MQQQYVISIMSRDEVGIIADVAQSISRLEGDLADIRQSVLRGYFTMILWVTFPAELSLQSIITALQKSQRHVNVELVNDVTPPAAQSLPVNHYVLTASGRDRIGFVANVTSFCARQQINILDLSTTQADGDYVMMLLVDLTNAAPLVTVRWHLHRFAEESGFRLVLQHHDIFKATHEVS